MEILSDETFRKLCNHCLEYKTRCSVVVSTRQDALQFMNENALSDEVKERFGIKRCLRSWIEFVNGSCIVIIPANMAMLRGHRFEKVLCSLDCIRHADLETLHYVMCLERSNRAYWVNSEWEQCTKTPALADHDLGEMDTADVSALFG